MIPLSKSAQDAEPVSQHSDFEIVCKNCDSLAIVLDYPDDAPSSTLIPCHHCSAPRGTLGDLRQLAISDRQDLFDV